MLGNDTDFPVLEPSRFLSPDTHRFLSRRKLQEISDRKDDWLFIVAPDCYHIAHQIEERQEEYAGDDAEKLLFYLPGLTAMPFVCLPLPRAAMSLDDIRELLDIPPEFSDADIESKAFILVQGTVNQEIMQAVSRWVNIETLDN